MWQWTHDWIKLRQEYLALRQGRLIDLFYDDDAYVFARQIPNNLGDTVIVALNRSTSARNISFAVDSLGLNFQDVFLHPLMGGASPILQKRSVALTLPPRSAIAYLVRGATPAPH